MTWPDDPSNHLETRSDLAAGFYVITITNGATHDCSKEFNLTLEDKLGIIVIADITDVTCQMAGVDNGSISLIVKGGQSPYSIFWPSGSVDIVKDDNLSANDYVVTVTDFNGCIKENTFTVRDEPVMELNLHIAGELSCNGDQDGIVNASTVGGTSPYYVIWPGSDLDTTFSKTNLSAGTYPVTLVDGTGCTITKPITIDPAPSPLTLTVNVLQDVSCMGKCDGGLSATVTGGTGPYTYAWSNGEILVNSSLLCPGTHSVTVTDAHGCTITGDGILVDAVPITAREIIVAPRCGSCNGTISLVDLVGGDGGPYTYVWSGGGKGDPTYPSILLGLCAGTYNVTISDGSGCSSEITYAISNEGGPTGATFASGEPSCSNNFDVESTVTPIGGTGPYTYLWSTGGTLATEPFLNAGTHYVEITDISGCTFVGSVVLVEPAEIQVHPTVVNSSSATSCDGEITLAGTTGGSGPYTYFWSTYGKGDSQSNLCPGKYFVTTTDASGCTHVDSMFVFEPEPVVVLLVETNSIQCFGVCEGSLNVSATGGVAPYLYEWSNGMSGTDIYGLCAGSYDVKVTDGNGFIVHDNFILSEPPKITNGFLPQSATCGVCDGNVDVYDDAAGGGGGPYTYEWPNMGPIVPHTVGDLCVGTYIVTVSDKGNKCSQEFIVPVNEVGGPAFDISVLHPDGVCAGDCTDTLKVVPVDPAVDPLVDYKYYWSTGGTTDEIGPLCSGKYFITVMDLNECVTIAEATLDVIAPLSYSTFIALPTCVGFKDGIIEIITAGGAPPYSYEWLDPNIIGGPGAGLQGDLSAGTYPVVISDANGCTLSIEIVLKDKQPFNVGFLVNDILCFGDCSGSIDSKVSGATGNLYFLWSGGESTDDIKDLCPDTYIVNVVDDGGCSFEDQVTVVNNTTPLVLAINQVVDAVCAASSDGSIKSKASGGKRPYTYQWTGPDGFISSNNNISDLAPGIYDVILTDANLCIQITSVEVKEGVSLSLTLDDYTICEFGSTFLLAPTIITDAPTVSYNWYDSSLTSLGTTSTLDVQLSAVSTKYYIDVDAMGCMITDSSSVVQGYVSPPDAGVSVDIISGKQVTLGGSPTTTETGVGIQWTPSTYLSDDMIANPISTPTETTSYKVTVSNDIGCTSSDEILITVSDEAEINSGFTPNGDGVNDKWEIPFLDQYPNAIVTVFNRWGESIFVSEIGYPETWDGLRNGKPLPVGTYYYTIDLQDPNIKDVLNGPITIVR